MQHKPSPFYGILNEVNKAAAGEFPFLAVTMAVALPDICVSLASPNGDTNPAKYKQWCKDNLSKSLSYLSPDDLYSLRCGILHNGRVSDRLKRSPMKKVIFIPKGATRGRFINNASGDAFFCDVDEFCGAVTTAVFLWFEIHRENPIVKGNIPKMMQHRVNGLAPYVAGFPVIA